MDIIVNDTNIFIDMQSIGLLSEMCQLPFEIHTVDFVIAEITQPEQASTIKRLIEEGHICVHSFTADDVSAIVLEHASISGNLSIADVAVCYYARQGSFKLITGDRQLRNYAENQKLEVHGILYLFDAMVKSHVINHDLGAKKLKELSLINVRLPKSEIIRRIEDWSTSGNEK